MLAEVAVCITKSCSRKHLREGNMHFYKHQAGRMILFQLGLAGVLLLTSIRKGSGL